MPTRAFVPLFAANRGLSIVLALGAVAATAPGQVYGPNLALSAGVVGGTGSSVQAYQRPDVTTQSWSEAQGLMVLERRFTSSTSTSFGVRGQVIVSGVPFFSEVPLLSNARLPAVATMTDRWLYVVVAESLAGDIVAMSRSFQGSNSLTTTVAGGSDVQESPDIGGELTSVDDDALVVYRNATQDSIQIQQVTCAANGDLTPAGVVTLATAGLGVNFSRPRISKTGGYVGRYLVTWQSLNVLTGTTTIRAIALTRNLTVLGSLSLGTGRMQDVDGNGDEWIVAFERTGAGGDADIHATSVRWSTTSSTLTASAPVVVTAIANTEERAPAVAWLGNSALVGWERSAPGSSDTDLFVKTIDAFSCDQCTPTILMVNSNAPERQLALAGVPERVVNSVAIPGAVMAFAVESAAHAPYGDGWAAFYGATDGGRTSVPGGAACGAGGRTTFSCARVGNAAFQMQLRGARASATSWLVLSPFPTSLGCAPCTLVADPFAGFVSGAISTDADGNAALAIAIPGSSALSGAALVAQWIVNAPATAGACAFLNTDFSNGLSVRID
jgi:hypothetical protein